jgi:tetratricopeptide (TPR) repeat protein
MAEQERLRRKRPENFDAYELYLRAQASLRDMTREGNDLALSLVERALALEPRYAAVAGLGALAYTLRAAQGWSAGSEEERQKGLVLAAHALNWGQNDAEALSLAGYAIGYLGAELSDGIRAVDRAISLNPNSALALTNAGWLKTYLGLTESAIPDFELAKRLSPGDPGLYRLNTGLCCALVLQGDFLAAIEAGREAMADNPNYVPAHRILASALALAGRTEEARRVVEKMLQLDASITVSTHTSQSLLRFSGKFGRVLDGLRMAGLPE